MLYLIAFCHGLLENTEINLIELKSKNTLEFYIYIFI